MTDSARMLRKGLPLILLLMVLGLLRAERGTAELEGRVPGPSQLFRLAREPDGQAWTVWLLGETIHVHVKEALP